MKTSTKHEEGQTLHRRIWSDTIAELDEGAKKDMESQKEVHKCATWEFVIVKNAEASVVSAGQVPATIKSSTNFRVQSMSWRARTHMGAFKLNASETTRISSK